MFDFFQFEAWVQDIQILWIVIGFLIFAQIISIINQLSLARKNRKFANQIREMRKHIQFLSVQGSREQAVMGLSKNA